MCHSQSANTGAGGWRPIDESDQAKVSSIVRTVLTQLQQQNKIVPHKIENVIVVEALQQVVSGWNYCLVLRLMPSNYILRINVYQPLNSGELKITNVAINKNGVIV